MNSPASENSDSLHHRHRLLWRWSYFLFLIALVSVTLFMMIRSGSETDSFSVLVNRGHSLGNVEYWTLTSTFGYVKSEIEVWPRMAVAGTGDLPIVLLSSSSSDPWVAEKASLHYGWFLFAEGIALFFMVPSVISKAGRT